MIFFEFAALTCKASESTVSSLPPPHSAPLCPHARSCDCRPALPKATLERGTERDRDFVDWFLSYLTNQTHACQHPLVHRRASSGLFRCSTDHGPVFFVLYTAPLLIVIKRRSVLHHSHPDQSQLQKSSRPYQIPDLFLSMQKWIDDIKSWMTLHKLKLNDDKTKVMIVSTGRKFKNLLFLHRFYCR